MGAVWGYHYWWTTPYSRTHVPCFELRWMQPTNPTSSGGFSHSRHRHGGWHWGREREHSYFRLPQRSTKEAFNFGWRELTMFMLPAQNKVSQYVNPLTMVAVSLPNLEAIVTLHPPTNHYSLSWTIIPNREPTINIHCQELLPWTNHIWTIIIHSLYKL